MFRNPILRARLTRKGYFYGSSVPFTSCPPGIQKNEPVMRKILLVTLLLASLLFPPTPSLAATQEITLEQARSLVKTALKAHGDNVAKIQVEETTNDISGFYGFGAFDRQGPDVQNVVGWFAVSKRTGQVWNTTSCELYEFPSLEQQRKKLVRTAAHSTKNPCAPGQTTRVVRKPSPPRPQELPQVAQ